MCPLCRGSVVVELLFYVPPIVCGSSVFVFVLVCISLCPFWFCNYLDEDKRAGCFAVIIIWTSCCHILSVGLPRGAMGWSVVYDCGIPSFLHTFWTF